MQVRGQHGLGEIEPAPGKLRRPLQAVAQVIGLEPEEPVPVDRLAQGRYRGELVADLLLQQVAQLPAELGRALSCAVGQLALRPPTASAVARGGTMTAASGWRAATLS